MPKNREITDKPKVRAAGAGEPVPLDVLTELGHATTAYHEAPPDRVETARQEYEEALRKFNATVNRK